MSTLKTDYPGKGLDTALDLPTRVGRGEEHMATQDRGNGQNEGRGILCSPLRCDFFRGVTQCMELEIQKLEAAPSLLRRGHASVSFTVIIKMTNTTVTMTTTY